MYVVVQHTFLNPPRRSPAARSSSRTSEPRPTPPGCSSTRRATGRARPACGSRTASTTCSRTSTTRSVTRAATSATRWTRRTHSPASRSGLPSGRHLSRSSRLCSNALTSSSLRARPKPQDQQCVDSQVPDLTQESRPQALSALRSSAKSARSPARTSKASKCVITASAWLPRAAIQSSRREPHAATSGAAAGYPGSITTRGGRPSKPTPDADPVRGMRSLGRLPASSLGSRMRIGQAGHREPRCPVLGEGPNAMSIVHHDLEDLTVPRSSRRRASVAVLAALALCAVPAVGGGASAAPFGIGPSTIVSGASTLTACTAGASADFAAAYDNTEVEPQVAVNPTNPNEIIAVAQQDRWPDGGARGLSSWMSQNGGTSWAKLADVPWSACQGGPRPVRTRHRSLGVLRQGRERVLHRAAHRPGGTHGSAISVTTLDRSSGTLEVADDPHREAQTSEESPTTRSR